MNNKRIWICAGVSMAALGFNAFALAQESAATSERRGGVQRALQKLSRTGGGTRAHPGVSWRFAPRADIVTALTTGVMAPMAQGIVAARDRGGCAVSRARASSWDPPAPTGCVPRNGPIKASASDWPALGLDENSSRFQPNPGFRAADVPRLKVKWAFSMPGGGQPVVVGDWLFITNRGGKFYALDAKTGCVHWAIEDASSRTTPMVIRSSISPSGWATFVGVGKRVVRAFDAQSGKEIWHSESLENHLASSITGTPVVSGDQIFVPLILGRGSGGHAAELLLLHVPRQPGGARSEDRPEAVADLT